MYRSGNKSIPLTVNRPEGTTHVSHLLLTLPSSSIPQGKGKSSKGSKGGKDSKGSKGKGKSKSSSYEDRKCR